MPQGCAYQDGIVAQVDCEIYREGQGGNINIWHCIISRESSWNPWATGSAGERGLTQIHPVHIAWLGWARWAQMYQPVPNIAAAIELYVRAGYSFSPWRADGSCGIY